METCAHPGQELTTSKSAVIWPLLLGLLLLYMPVFSAVARELWVQDEYAHGPVILFVSLFLLWQARSEFSRASRDTNPRLGLAVFLLGILVYVAGRSQEITMFEIGSAPLVIAGLIIMFYGAATLGRVWFPIFFMVFMIPLPGMLVELVTMPMKMAVAYVAESCLYALGYPVARSGVILQIGQYTMFVADACAGLHTLLTLEAMGLFYIAVVRHSSLWRNVMLAGLIVPISFTANLIRVMSLTLVTFYLGDAAGQGFLHNFAGLVLFVSALLIIVSVDAALRVKIHRH